MIIFRYLSKEVFTTLLAVTVILMLIFISNEVVRYLELAAVGKIAGAMLLKITGLEIPLLLGLLLPVGLYLGILLAFGRLFADSEMTVLKACGISTTQLLGMVMIMACVVALGVGFFMLWLNPNIMHYKNHILDDKSTANLLQTIIPGRFQATGSGRSAYYVEKMSRNHERAKQIFSATPGRQGTGRQPQSWDVVAAHHAHQSVDKTTKDKFLVLEEGYRFSGAPGTTKFRVSKFKNYGIRVGHALPHRIQDEDEWSTLKLWKASMKDLDAQAELQWRLAMPISVFILALIAIPLSRVKPRQGKYAQLLPAILLFIVYANMLFVGKTWLEDGSVPASLGLWWVHGLMLLIGLSLWANQFSWHRKPKGHALEATTELH